jgi:hypothetical protein
MVRIFIGDEGFRYWWRFFLFALAMWLAGRFVEISLSGFFAKQLGINPDVLSAPAVIVSELVGLTEVLLVTDVASLLEQWRIDVYGLQIDQAFGKVFWREECSREPSWLHWWAGR